MSSESVCHVVRSWVDVGYFHTRLVVRFVIVTASVRNILDTAGSLDMDRLPPVTECHCLTGGNRQQV
jgi:hypothetical protein